jgi:hypothetical protein
MLMAEVSPRAGNVTFGVIALLASAGLAHSLGKSLWIDEAASLYSAHLSWHDLWRQSKVVDRASDYADQSAVSRYPGAKENWID